VAAPEALIAWAASAAKADVAALAPRVAEAAAAGDAVARAIVDHAARDLADHVRALYARLQPWPGTAEVALAGGLLGGAGPLRRPAAAAVQARGLPLRIRDEPVDAARGAAALARAAGLAT